MSFRERDGVTVSYSTSTDEVEYWIDGGFFVRQQWTTLHDYTCFAETGETVCIWYNVAHTAYTVWNHYVNMCDGNEVHSDPFILFSPNQGECSAPDPKPCATPGDGPPGRDRKYYDVEDSMKEKTGHQNKEREFRDGDV